MEPTWGDQSESTEIYGLEMKSTTYKKILPDDKKYENYQHAAHVLLFSPTDKISLKKYERKAVVLVSVILFSTVLSHKTLDFWGGPQMSQYLST